MPVTDILKERLTDYGVLLTEDQEYFDLTYSHGKEYVKFDLQNKELLKAINECQREVKMEYDFILVMEEYINEILMTMSEKHGLVALTDRHGRCNFLETVDINGENYWLKDDDIIFIARYNEYFHLDEAVYCEDVDRYELEEDANYCDYCQASYYSHCCDEDNNGLYCHDYKPTPNFLKAKNETTKLYFGVEIEFHRLMHSGFRESLEQDLEIYCKEDGSLEDGVEVVSHPFTQKRYLSNQHLFEKICKQASYYDGFTNSGSGIHVHISRNAFSDEERDIFEEFIINESNQMYIDRVAGRDASTWAVRIKGKDKGKYYAVNRTENTIEVRIFRSSKNPLHVLGRIEFVQCLCELLQEKKTITQTAILKKSKCKKYHNLFLLLTEKQLCAGLSTKETVNHSLVKTLS